MGGTSKEVVNCSESLRPFDQYILEPIITILTMRWLGTMIRLRVTY